MIYVDATVLVIPLIQCIEVSVGCILLYKTSAIELVYLAFCCKPLSLIIILSSNDSELKPQRNACGRKFCNSFIRFNSVFLTSYNYSEPSEEQVDDKSQNVNEENYENEPQDLEELTTKPTRNAASIADNKDTAEKNSETFNSFQFWKSPLPEIDVDSESTELVKTNGNKDQSTSASAIPELRVIDFEKPDEVLYLSKQLSETMSDFDIEEEISLNSSETLAEHSIRDHERILAQVSLQFLATLEFQQVL